MAGLEPEHTYAVVSEINGPTIVGALIQHGLWGVSAVMAYDYYLYFTDDSIYLKSFVAWLMMLNTLKTGLLFDLAWQKSIRTFGDWSTVVAKKYTVSNKISILMSVFLAASSQIFFGSIAWRATNRNYYFLGGILSIIALSFAGGFGIFVNLVAMETPNINAIKFLPEIWWWAMLSGDVIITSVLTWKFKTLQKGAGQETKNLLSSFIALSLRTAALTTTCVLTERILHLADEDLWAQVPGTAIAGLFVISAIHTLTSRKSLQSVSNDATASRTRGRFAFGRKSGAADLKTHGAFDGTRTEVHYETHILQEMSHNPDLPKARPLINGDEDLITEKEKPFGNSSSHTPY